jgi:hypothetical protein
VADDEHRAAAPEVGLAVEYRSLDPQYRLQADLEVFKVVSEHFRNDFRMVWEHSSLFVVIQGAFLSVFASISSDGRGEVADGLALVGIVLTLMWWWVVTGRMYLVDQWRVEMRNIDLRVDHLAIYSTMEQRVTKRWFLDSTRVIARLLPPTFLVGWLILLRYTGSVGDSPQ